jgi:hypothetical protein
MTRQPAHPAASVWRAEPGPGMALPPFQQGIALPSSNRAQYADREQPDPKLAMVTRAIAQNRRPQPLCVCFTNPAD